MKYVVLLGIALLQIVLSVVLSYRRSSKVSQAVMAIAISLGVWTIANTLLDYGQYVAAASTNVLTVLNQFAFFMGVISLLFIYRLTFLFPLEREVSRFQKYLMVIGSILPVSVLSSFVSGTFYIEDGSEVASYTYGSGVLGVAVVTLLFGVSGYINVKKAMRHKLNKKLRIQAKTVYGALTITVVLGIVFTTILPLIVNDPRNLIIVGYYVPFIFSFSLFYSLLRQNFLNFRQIIARTIGYILTILVVGSLFSLISFMMLDRLIFKNSDTSIGQILGYALISIGLAVSFQYVVVFFNSLSNRLFYREAYEPQKFLDNLSATLVGSIEVGDLLHKVSETIKLTFHLDHVTVLIETENGYSLQGDQINDSEIDTLKKNLPKADFSHSKYLIEDNERDSGGSSLLGRTGVALALPLEARDQRLGFMLCGVKRSGSNFTSQDIRLLTIASGQIALALQNALRFQEISRFNETLEQKVEEATRQLRRSNEKLKALDETKDEFISMASHQLRTPLTSVKGYVSMVLEGDAGKLNKQQESLLTQAYNSSQRMVYLIADLLNVSRLKTGKFVIDRQPTQLADVIEGEIQQLQETAKARNLTLTFNKPKDFPLLNIDETKTRQVIMNFADNAIYYTPAGGNITLELTEKGASIEFSVTDTGIGVPKAEQHHLFTKFYRANNAQKARPDGTGLGLFMAKKVIVAQGGAVIFRSREGKGSTFGFSFPKATVLATDKTV